MCCCVALTADDIEVLRPEIAQREAEACPRSMILYICSGNGRIPWWQCYGDMPCFNAKYAYAMLHCV